MGVLMMTKKVLILGAAIASALTSGAAMAVDGLSANAGIVSDYYFRGVQQTGSASANGGVDYDIGNGLSVGVWAADVEGQGPSGATGSTPAQGIEIDVYGSYAGEIAGFGYSVGVTHYGYTGDFDTEYNEVNLGGSYGDFALDIAVGSRDEPGGTDQDYDFTSVSYGTGPFSVTYGVWGSDFEGAYLEVGLSTDIGGADAGISFINGDPDDSAKNIVTDGTALVFSLSKSFEL
jgi:uncharacterized protein (TIGR02001 family)